MKKSKYLLYVIITTLLIIIPNCSKAPVEVYTSKGLIDKRIIVKELLAQNFIAVDSIIQHIHTVYIRDFEYEYAAFDAISTFDVTDSQYTTLLTKWNETLPNSIAAKIALGQHYVSIAYQKRGGKYMKDTPKENVMLMEKYIAMAEKVVHCALANDSNWITGYYVLMNCARSAGDTLASERYFNQAPKVNPDGFLIRTKHLQNLVPRWGGSHKQMETFIKKQLVNARNPQMKILWGFIPYDKGTLTHVPAVEKIRYSPKPLSNGGHVRFYSTRAYLYYDQGEYEKALSDYNAALTQLPQRRSNLVWRGMTYYKLSEQRKRDLKLNYLRAAQKDFTLAKELDPYDKHMIEWSKHAAEMIEYTLKYSFN